MVVYKGEIDMTLETLEYAIGNLIKKRAKAHGNDVEQKRINEKLTRLYDLKYLMLVFQ